MKTRLSLILTLALVCAVVFFSAQPSSAVLYGTRGDEEGIPWKEGIKDWKEEFVNAEVTQEGFLKVTQAGNEARGIVMFQGGDNPAGMTDYEVETFIRKKPDGPYLALHARINEPAKDFFLIEISYWSHTVSTHKVTGGAFTEITPGGGGGRPKRPEPRVKIDGDDAYVMRFSIEGEILSYWIDDKLIIITDQADTWKTGPPGLGAQGTTNIYEWVRIDTIPPGQLGIESTEKQLAVDPSGKIAVTWGRLKKGF